MRTAVNFPNSDLHLLCTLCNILSRNDLPYKPMSVLNSARKYRHAEKNTHTYTQAQIHGHSCWGFHEL